MTTALKKEKNQLLLVRKTDERDPRPRDGKFFLEDIPGPADKGKHKEDSLEDSILHREVPFTSVGNADITCESPAEEEEQQKIPPLEPRRTQRSFPPNTNIPSNDIVDQLLAKFTTAFEGANR